MCPACIAATLAMVAGPMSASGLCALLIRKQRKKAPAARSPQGPRETPLRAWAKPPG